MFINELIWASKSILMFFIDISFFFFIYQNHRSNPFFTIASLLQRHLKCIDFYNLKVILTRNWWVFLLSKLILTRCCVFHFLSFLILAIYWAIVLELHTLCLRILIEYIVTLGILYLLLRSIYHLWKVLFINIWCYRWRICLWRSWSRSGDL